jgi:hypothetical protein
MFALQCTGATAGKHHSNPCKGRGSDTGTKDIQTGQPYKKSLDGL